MLVTSSDSTDYVTEVWTVQEGGGEYKKGLSAKNDTTAYGSSVGIQPPDHHSVTTDKPISNKRLIKAVYRLPRAKENINIPSSTVIETTADIVIIGGKNGRLCCTVFTSWRSSTLHVL